MTSKINIFIPGPVRGKGRPRAAHFGPGIRMYTDKQTLSYEAEVRSYALDAMGGMALLDGAVRMEFTACFAPPQSTSKKKRAAMLAGEMRPTKKPDADNILKIADALNGVVFRDDAQVVEAVVHKVFSERPGLSISVEAI